MAGDKEAFLSRWSRLKREQPAEQKEEAPVPTLPPIESLTPESEFSGFMHPKVKEELRRLALKKLFSDPHFNLPDPYEAYSGDWTGESAMTPEFVATLNQARSVLFNEEEKKAADERDAAEKKLQDEAKLQGEAKPDEPGRQDT
jgi:hypothetical protein